MHNLLLLLSALVVAVAASHAAAPEGLAYWNRVLPSTPIPSAIKDILTPPVHDSVDTTKAKPSNPDGPRVDLAVKIRYRDEATDAQLRDESQTASFFLEKKLQSGKIITLPFTSPASGAPFLSRREADSVPFASNKFADILHHFSVAPTSPEAEAMKQTLLECEKPAMDGETRHCATSLESMVEFSTASIGSRDLRVVSTNLDRENLNALTQLYIIKGVEELSASNLVICHAESYPYAVFYCHTTEGTKTYRVSMVGEDGTKAEAVAVCHSNTAGWNPKHIAFVVLKVKPGTVPICHLLPQDHLLWIPKV